MTKKTGRQKPHPGRRDEQPWTPLQPAKRVPMKPAARAALLEKGVTEEFLDQLEAEEVWMNDLYVVSCTRRPDGTVYEISIRRQDRKAIHDWRHFQRIKNEMAGAETEAVELYPRMSRLMDTANQYYLWCLPPGETIEVGFNYPRANLADDGEHAGTNAQQRALPNDWKESTNDATAE